MPIAITEDHRALGQTASDFLAKHDARGAARALLEADAETLPAVLGRRRRARAGSGLHLPEDFGGSGFGLPELVVVVEELGRAVAPGPFVPTVIASAVIDAAGSDDAAGAALPGLADGSVRAGVALSSDITVVGGHGRRDGSGGPGRWPRPDARAAGGRRRHRGRRRRGRGRASTSRRTSTRPVARRG